MRRNRFVMVALFLSGLSLFVSAYLFRENNLRIRDNERSREESIRISCRDTNDRNVKARGYLQGLTASSPNQRRLSRREQRIIVREFTNALVGPVRSEEECEARVRRLVPDD